MKSTVENKIEEVVEALSNNNSNQAQSLISKMLSKKKVSSKILPKDMKKINLLQSIVYNMQYEYGQAEKIFRNYLASLQEFTHEDAEIYPKIIEKLAVQFNLLPDIAKKYEIYMKKNEQKKEIVEQYLYILIKDKNFFDAKNVALKLFNLTKRNVYFLASNWLQYMNLMQNSDKSNLLTQLNLLMAFQKKRKDEFVSPTSSLAEIASNQLAKQHILLDIEILFLQEKYDELAELLNKFQENFIYREDIHIIHNIYEKTKLQKYLDLLITLHINFEEKNANISKFIALYDCSKKGINLLCNIIQQNIHIDSIIKEPDSTAQGSVLALEKWLHLLYSNIMILGNDENLKNHNNYLYFMKNNLCSLIHALTILEEKKKILGDIPYSELLFIYTKIFGQNLTFSEEIQQLLIHKPDLCAIAKSHLCNLAGSEKSPVKETLLLVNVVKMDFLLHEIKFMGRNNMLEIVAKLINSYLSSFSKCYPKFEKAEKGERLAMDDYVIIALDVLLKNFDDEHYDGSREEIAIIGSFLGYCANKYSPYNFDILIRRMLLNHYCGFYEENYELAKQADIKAVQYETLSFLIFSSAFQMGIYNFICDHSFQAYHYFSECNIESKESVIHCLKNDNFSRIKEFQELDSITQRSYVKFLYLYTAFETNLTKSKPEDQSYLLDCLVKNMNQKLTFNCDVRIAQRVIFDSSDDGFVNYFGYLNDPLALKLLIYLKKIQLLIPLTEDFQGIPSDLYNETKKIIQELDVSRLASFEHFDVIRKHFDASSLITGKKKCSDIMTKCFKVFRSWIELRFAAYSVINFAQYNKNHPRDELIHHIVTMCEKLKEFSFEIKKSCTIFLPELMKINFLILFYSDIEKIINFKQKICKGLKEHSKLATASTEVQEKSAQTETLLKEFNLKYKEQLKEALAFIQNIQQQVIKMEEFSFNFSDLTGLIPEFSSKFLSWRSTTLNYMTIKCESLVKKLQNKLQNVVFS